MRPPKPASRARHASSTAHQPGRAQNPKQVSQLQGSDGGYFSFKFMARKPNKKLRNRKNSWEYFTG
jgi:hypothetical protein